MKKQLLLLLIGSLSGAALLAQTTVTVTPKQVNKKFQENQKSASTKQAKKLDAGTYVQTTPTPVVDPAKQPATEVATDKKPAKNKSLRTTNAATEVKKIKPGK